MIKKYANSFFLKLYEKIILNFFSYIIAYKTKKICRLIISDNSYNKKKKISRFILFLRLVRFK